VGISPFFPRTKSNKIEELHNNPKIQFIKLCPLVGVGAKSPTFDDGSTYLYVTNIKALISDMVETVLNICEH